MALPPNCSKRRSFFSRARIRLRFAAHTSPPRYAEYLARYEKEPQAYAFVEGEEPSKLGTREFFLISKWQAMWRGIVLRRKFQRWIIALKTNAPVTLSVRHCGSPHVASLEERASRGLAFVSICACLAIRQRSRFLLCALSPTPSPTPSRRPSPRAGIQ